jgi:Tfp pilus assembly protein PilE
MMEGCRSLQCKKIFVLQRGFTLLEGVVTIGIVAMLLIVILSVFNIIKLHRSAQYQAIARQLIIEESEALRNAGYNDLENRAATPFIEVAYNRGAWSIADPAGPRSAPHVYRCEAATGGANPSQQVVPLGWRGDGSYEAAFRALPTSPSGWKTGLYVRYHDERNYYLLRANTSALELLRVVEGVSTTVWSTAMTFSTNTWYRLTVAITGDAFTVSVDGTVKTGTPVTDPTFARGQFILGAFDGALVEFDDVSYSGAVSFSWDFDSGETVGSIARGWRRMGPTDLPSGATSMTITDAVTGYTDMKQISTTVSWYERGATRSLATTYYLNERNFQP